MVGYGPAQLVASMRAVRRNTLLMAEDIPETGYGYRATPETRSVAETLVHIAWLGSADQRLHQELHLDPLEGFDFGALLAESAAEEKRVRSKQQILYLLREEGERWASWVESLPEPVLSEPVALPGGTAVTRFELLLGTKEHELQHRAQLTVLQRLLRIAPRFTGLA